MLERPLSHYWTSPLIIEGLDVNRKLLRVLSHTKQIHVGVFVIFQILSILNKLNPKKTGGPKRPPPLDISRDYSATRKALAATLYDFFLSSFPHILTPNLWCPGVQFWTYVTFCTCTSDQKWLENVILCTKSMQIEFFHKVHINMLIFTLNGWN